MSAKTNDEAALAVVPGETFSRREIKLHGHRITYRTAGNGPELLLLIHGVAGSSRQWEPTALLLADRYTVLAPDLLGHGESAKPRGDYSLGAYAVMIRDLMIALGYRRATVVGHSLGGGIAMQFAYQYPMFCERLVLVSSGGLGREVHLLLRAATLPLSEVVLPVITHARVLKAGSSVGRWLGLFGLDAAVDIAEMARSYVSLGDRDAQQAFVHTLRAVIEPSGQRVNATDRLYLAEEIPTLIIWGRHDPLIPVAHADVARRGMPQSEVAVFERSGHFPQLDDPIRFARRIRSFIDSTRPAQIEFTEADIERLRKRMLRGPAAPKRAARRRVSRKAATASA